MKLTLFIGPSEKTAMRLRNLFKQFSGPLAQAGVAIPEWNPVRLYAACAGVDDVGVLRFKRGLDKPHTQRRLTEDFETLLRNKLPKIDADHVAFASAQLGNLLHSSDELGRLHALLSPHFTEVRIVAHVDEQARMLVQHYTYAIKEGRQYPLHQEIDLAREKDWWNAALALRGENQPQFGIFNDIHYPPHWLDYAALINAWETSFGSGTVTLRPLDQVAFNSANGMEELCACLNIPNTFGKAEPDRVFQPDPAASLTRMRHMNEVMIRLSQARNTTIPRDMWPQVHKAVRIGGDPIDAGSLSAISKRFKADNAGLITRFPALATALQPDTATAPYQEADPQFGFRATQYLASFSQAIRKVSTEITAPAIEVDNGQRNDDPTDEDRKATNQALLNRVRKNHTKIVAPQFTPHNLMGTVNEEETAAPYTAVPQRKLKSGSSGNVIVACMKNEAPYIVEWIAHHRALGVDNFLIYTNDCSDGTDQVLGRLMEMGILQHRNNNNWDGNSPQQSALNKSLTEPLIQNAEWIIHIDVDEFMNVRTGNGTLDDFFAAVPDATNIAMTWRLFGHNDVTQFNDTLVIDQFDTCAPKFCPKPHTVWGFKTMSRNIGAYAKISCHRPNDLAPKHKKKVKWVNGSGQDMTRYAAKSGWRSSKKNIGYDLLQLNHYALRSAESFLIKRQRGRALHVDRSIGINYWVRMDWSDFLDVTIKRNIPRLRAEYDRLMQDPVLNKAHQDGVKWHKAKAKALRATPEFAELYQQAVELKLNPIERVAYASALDMES